MSDTADQNIRPSPFISQKCGCDLPFLFCSTLLSTIDFTRLSHLILSALVHEPNQLFKRAMLYMFNPKTEVLKGVAGICREAAADLYIVDQDAENMRPGYWTLTDEAVEKQRNNIFYKAVISSQFDLKKGCQVISRAVQKSSPCVINRDKCLDCQDCTQLEKLNLQSFAIAPLITHNRLVGGLLVDKDGGNGFEKRQLRLLQLVASQCGMALENSQLYRNLEKTHAELRTVRQRLVHSTHLAALGEVVASLSHELKTPLATIGGFASRLSKTLPPEALERQYADIISSETHRLEHLLGDVLSFSRKSAPGSDCFDLCAVIMESVADYALAFEEQGIVCQLKLPDEHCLITGDAYQLKQVVINLLVNAQEAMPDGGILKISLTRSYNRKASAVVAIQDSGGGIPEEFISSIFKPFFTTKQRGTGLGLSIVGNIVRNHGGGIAVRNHEDGAEFKIILPLAINPD